MAHASGSSSSPSASEGEKGSSSKMKADDQQSIASSMDEDLYEEKQPRSFPLVKDKKDQDLNSAPGVRPYAPNGDLLDSQSRAPSRHDTEGIRDAPDLHSIPSNRLSRALSRTVTRSSWSPGPPPDGGLEAWLVVLGAHCVNFNCWGFINSFGVFQPYYVDLLGRSQSDVAWIGSTQTFLVFFIGAFTGRLTDMGYFRHLYIAGVTFMLTGIFMTAQGTQYWHFLLSHGICMGIGYGCLFCPVVAVTSTWFSKKRAFAMGMVASSTGTGGLVFPIMVRQLLPMVGFSWTMRTIGFVQMALLFVSGFIVKTRVPPRKQGSFLDLTAFKELQYAFYVLGAFFSFLGVFVVFIFVVSYSQDIVGLSYTDALNLMMVLNGAGVPGRIVPNYIADRVGVINMFIIFASVSGICGLSWMAVTTVPSIYPWTFFFGFFAGGIQSLFPAGASALSPDLRKRGVRIGMVFSCVSIAALTGSPIAGALISAMNGSYMAAQLFVGGSLLMGSGFLVASNIVVSRELGNIGWPKV
ncbi:hypothetical protein MCOR25_009483 [Pyricularia grisea]|uniref:Major facilitator superfamily (MFS) profile domain-containing protein n=1 Tax=Pyricularia grisea TaxID=148305 RepID=A0A6P8BFX9_PYRGI|nr:uncharacterized protein PgNI_00572 [Pyricularia grisea]KAI6352213.1 hypothetical protein MCOR25_009483 [Pyricularia grisea]TLD15547.1 hypothetical protein PgNI_00572 [Pyricularia grisea]